jgi:hypothetical protein
MGRSNLSREFDFRLKRWLGWSAPVRKQAVGSFGEFAKALSPDQRERYKSLRAIYDSSGWPALCTRAELQGNLHILDLLHRAIGSERPRGPSLDIGSLNWWYLPALAAAVPGAWDGVEVDAHQRYLSLSTRRGHGEWMCSHYPQTQYHACSVTEMSGHYGFISWLLPYVLPQPLASAGLPDRFFEPDRLLGHAWSRLEPGGRLWIVNQNKVESLAQQQLFEKLGIDARSLGLTDSVFATEGDDERHSWIATKRA